MQPQEFASAYDKPQKYGRFFDSIDNEVIHDILERYKSASNMFDSLLHTRLILGAESVSAMEIESIFAFYANNNAVNDIVTILDLMPETADSETQLEMYGHAQQLVFHLLTMCTLTSWYEMLTDTTTPADERNSSITTAKFALAQQAVGLGAQRSTLSTPQNDYTYFSPDESPRRAFIHGTLAEIDTTIVLLEMTRRDPDFVFVPAPPQFESSRRTSVNADFIALQRRTGEVVGIQTKARERPEDRDRYDDKRIVIINGMEDLGGAIWARKGGKRPAETSLTCWPGLVALDIIDSISLHGPGSAPLQQFTPNSMLRIKHHARTLLCPPYDSRGQIKNSANDAVTRVREKLRPYLEPEI